MKCLPLLVALLLVIALPPARADTPDNQFVRIYNLIQQADALSKSDPTAALPKYVEAQTALKQLQKNYPEWYVKVVKFRLNYLETKIAALAPPGAAPAPAAPAPTPASPAKTTPPAASPAQRPAPAVAPATEAENQLAALQADVRRLQAEKGLLELKLKEALATQPAAVDPRELAKAQEKIQALLKENELLKAAPAPAAAQSAPAAEAKALAETQAALTEASRKLKEQTERANALAAEKTVLQKRLDSLTPSADNAAELDRLKQARAEAERKLADQTNLATRLAAEKEALQNRVQALSESAAGTEALRAENELLKKQLAAASTSGGRNADADRKLAQAEARVASLQSDAEILRLEKIALENRVRTLGTATPAAAARPEDLQRIKLLETERFDLAMKLDAANKDLYGRKGRATAAKVEELTTQVTTLRARLEVYEARAVPYTAEELALFKQPQPVPVADPKAGKKSVKELPRGTAALVAEAQREFAAKRYDKAEEKYMEVLRQDEKNSFTLANLAAIQLELNRLDEVDKNIQKALALDPDDAYSLSILGYLRYRQEKYDEALDALSKSAKLNPQSPEVQNYLGVTLSHKGLRGPAETALRKAIQLDPGYGAAHNNLAVIYATQQPPLIELARWHYQRALGAGHPRNPDLEKLFDQKTAAPAHAP